MGNYMDKRVTPPKRVTSLIWVPPPPRKQTLIHKNSIILQHAYFTKQVNYSITRLHCADWLARR